MKIPLNVNQNGKLSSKAAITQQLERELHAAKGGDWTARNNLVRRYNPLLLSLAQKRASDTAEINRLMELGKHGLLKAASKYKKSVGASRFQIFALDYVEAAMDGKKDGFFSRLFGK